MRERSQRFDPRQTMQRDTFEVFHYREPRANTVEVHHHDFYEIYYLISGNVEYWVDGRIIRMEPGDLLLINPMELHRPLLEQGMLYERFVLWIHKDFLESISQQEPLDRCFDTTRPNHTHLIRLGQSDRTTFMTRLAEMVRESYSRDFGSKLSADGLFLQLMVQLNRLAKRTKAEESQQLSALVQSTLQYITEHLAEPISLEQLSAELYVSKYHLSHAFSREVGVSIYRYIMLRRLLLARQLLTQGQSAKQVCRSCGFADYTSFYRAFKSEYGISPRDFLNQ
jgi:AraC-like DNA-binding protein